MKESFYCVVKGKSIEGTVGGGYWYLAFEGIYPGMEFRSCGQSKQAVRT